MWNRLIFGKTIKARLLRYNFIIICIIAVIFSISSYQTSNRKTTQIAKNSLIYHVQSISYRYQMAYENMLNIVLGCTERRNFDLYQLGDFTTPEAKKKGLEYARTIANFCAITGYSNYITRLSVFNESGILIQSGTAAASIDDSERILNASWFKNELGKTMDLYVLDVVHPLFYKDNTAMLPIIGSISSSREQSYVALCLSTKLFEDVLKENDNGQEVIVVTHTGERIASLWEEEEFKEENDRLIQELLQNKESKGFMEISIRGEKFMAAYERYGRSGIMVVEFLPLDSLKNDRLVILQTVLFIFLGGVTLGLILSLIFTNQVRKPINRLVEHLSGIAAGDFAQDKTIESEDEIGTIGKVVNKMSGQIEQLLEERVEDEKERSSLELKMLQAQINPHFLYNTLDSIKWIAVIQKNSGIVKAVTALSGLLRNMAKGFNEKVTLQKELDFLNDYVIIEKMKYVEIFDVIIEVDEPELYAAKVIKLTLQPLVENSIFSGIEPNGKNGLIKIHAYAEEEKLYLTVYDNGIGIKAEKLSGILEGRETLDGERMSGIGLVNVDRRIKLAYGEEYGLKVESKEGEFTRITVVTPLEY